MQTNREALSSRQAVDNDWVPSCIGFTCGKTKTPVSTKQTKKSAPILILKGLGTMTLGRVGEESNILRDDIVTWKRRVEDSLYIGYITYTATLSDPDDIDDMDDDTILVSSGNGANLSVVVIDDLEEFRLKEVEDKLAGEKGLNKTLPQLLQVLLNRDFSGALRLLNDVLDTAKADENKISGIEDSIQTAFATHNKAVLEMANGIFKQAVHYFKESLDLKESLLGTNHKSVLETMEQLAVALYGLRAYSESQSTLRSIHCRSDSRALAARTWNAIACLHFQKGETRFALQCVDRAVVLYFAGSKAAEFASTIALANKGYMELASNLAEAHDTLEEAEEKLCKWLGTNNEIVQSIRYNMNQ